MVNRLMISNSTRAEPGCEGHASHAAYSRKTRATFVVLSACLLTLSACNARPPRHAPATYSVTGQVTAPNGRSMAGGCIEFRPRDNAGELTSTGVIDAEGKFTLQIPFIDRIIPGATEGPHRAFVIMPLGAQRKGGGHVPIPGEFTVKPGENHFTIALPSGSS